MTTPIVTRWVDPKRYLWLLSLVAVLLPLIGYALFRVTGHEVFWWFTPIFVYGVLPALDSILGDDSSNPPDSAIQQLGNDLYYRYAVYAAVPLQYCTFFWGCYMAARGGLGTVAWLGLLMSVGMVSGMAVNTGHELGHKQSPFERWMAKLSLAPGLYGHFFVEHNRGHHTRVSTPEDPASSRFGESFYAFYPRCVAGSVISAVGLERVRLRRSGKSFWSVENDLLNAWALTLVIWTIVITTLGWGLLPFLVVQALYGGSLLEVVNYLEHYGLCRQRLPNGKYERCQPKHSWNSNHIVTNLFLYQLQRHSDHHASPTRSYQTLRHFDESPQLPSGYASMMLVAYLPPLWFWIMNQRVVKHYSGDMRLANIKPSLRARVLAAQRPAQPQVEEQDGLPHVQDC